MIDSARAISIAAIDVGTNTALLLVARPRPPAGATARGAGGGPGAGDPADPGGSPGAKEDPDILEDAAEITRLGRGIGADGGLGIEGIERTLAALRGYAALAAKHGAAIVAVGTEALRRAPNAAAFLEPARRILGVPVEVIDGDREADLTFRAVAESFPDDIERGRVAVVDIGGGSTEIILVEQGKVVFRRSMPLGSVRLHERHIRSDPPTAQQARALVQDVESVLDREASAFTACPVRLLVGVAGTVTSLAAMALGLTTYDPARVHGAWLSLAEIEAQSARLEGSSQVERARIVGLDPRRADVIFAGALLLSTILRRAGADGVRVSDRGIRWGLYYERAVGRRPAVL